MNYRETDMPPKGQTRGRPRLKSRTRLIRITLSLRPGEDEDLLAYFDRVPAGKRAETVKEVLRWRAIGYAAESRGVARSL